MQSIKENKVVPTPATHIKETKCAACLLTKKEAATYLNIAPRTLDDWRAARAIACIERPGYVRFLPSDLDDFIARHRRCERTAPRFRTRMRHLTRMTKLSDQAISAGEQSQSAQVRACASPISFHQHHNP